MLTPLLTTEALMKRPTEFIDEHGVKWITPARAAGIWNERVMQKTGKPGHYTRWSIFQRHTLKRLPTPGGDLYLESEIREVKLRPHPSRPDITRDRKGKKKHEIYKKQEPQPPDRA